ncbi:hypothetical protein [Brucella anthropi]|uniref:hypothetical protein n=1 Tax=Brucella anthropi TaxID=529 RepID=UPI0002D97FAE|nr:hypothetical protein [Brucella anthropi]RRY08871.1 hypothetical protein EGJ58_13315 [Brucella anthropi]SUA65366.1 Uncharacterised protein [Brucella anthropi]
MERFSAQEKLAELEREITFRHRTYSRLVKAGKMKLPEAQRRIQLLTDIANDYRNAASNEPDLFKRKIT